MTTFPLALSEFFGLLEMTPNFELDIDENVTSVELADATLMTTQTSSPKWMTAIETIPMSLDEFKVVTARKNSMRGGLYSFYMYDPGFVAPLFDQTGVLMSSLSPAISGVGAGGGTISFSGFPPGYQLSASDRFSFFFASAMSGNNDRLAYHSCLTGGVANGGGNITNIEVYPSIRGAPTGLEVSFFIPIVEMKMVPRSWSPSAVSSLFSSVSFKARQVV